MEEANEELDHTIVVGMIVFLVISFALLVLLGWQWNQSLQNDAQNNLIAPLAYLLNRDG